MSGPSRRGFLGTLAASPLIGRAVGRQLSSNVGFAEAQQFNKFADAPNETIAGSPSLMPYKTAVRLALQNKEALDDFTSHLYREYRRVHSIDPDIDVHRSFSLAAKIAYQRQRHVEQMIASEINERSVPRLFEKLLSRLMGREL